MGTRSRPMYTTAIARPRRILRLRNLTGGASANAINAAMNSQVIGRRSKYTTYAARAAANTINVARNTADVDKRTTQHTSTSRVDVLRRVSGHRSTGDPADRAEKEPRV